MNQTKYDYDINLRGLLAIILDYQQNKNDEFIEIDYITLRLSQIIGNQSLDFSPEIERIVSDSNK